MQLDEWSLMQGVGCNILPCPGLSGLPKVQIWLTATEIFRLWNKQLMLVLVEEFSECLEKLKGHQGECMWCQREYIHGKCSDGHHFLVLSVQTFKTQTCHTTPTHRVNTSSQPLHSIYMKQVQLLPYNYKYIIPKRSLGSTVICSKYPHKLHFFALLLTSIRQAH